MPKRKGIETGSGGGRKWTGEHAANRASSSGKVGDPSGQKKWSFTAVVLAALLAYKLYSSTPDLAPGSGALGDLLRKGKAMPGMELKVTNRIFEGTGPGLAAARAFEPGDVVMEIPSVDASFISWHQLPRAFREAGELSDGSLGDKQRLVLALLHELREPRSDWKPWLEALPRRVDNLGGMGELHRRALGGLSIAVMFAQFDELVEAVGRWLAGAPGVFSPPFSRAEITWAASIMESRAHSLGEERVLSPFAAMANHHPDTSRSLRTVWAAASPSKPAARQYLAPHALSPGDEVFTHYGAHSNIRLLMQYGFCIEGVALLDRVPVKFFEILGSHIFRVGNRYAPTGPSCKDMSNNPANTLTRDPTQQAGIPELVINCWRLSQIHDEEVAQAAVDAGLFDPARKVDWSRLPKSFLELDSASYESIAAACSEVRDLYNVSNGEPLSELLALNDSLSRRLHTSLVVEIQAWDRCRKDMLARAANLRALL